MNCSGGIPIGTTGVVLIKLQGTISLRPNDQFVQVTVGLASRVKLGDVPVVSGEGSAKITTAPGFGLDLSAAISVLSYQAASAEVSISEAQGFRTKIELSPPLFYASLEIKAWAKDGAFFFTGSGRARVQVCAGCVWKKWFIKMPPFEIRSPGCGRGLRVFPGRQLGHQGLRQRRLVPDRRIYQQQGRDHFWQCERQGAGYAEPDCAHPQGAANRRAHGHPSRRAPLPRIHLCGGWQPAGGRAPAAAVWFDGAFGSGMQPSDAISPTNVITQADTIFSMATAGPLAMSLIAPDNTEITPANAGTLLNAQSDLQPDA